MRHIAAVVLTCACGDGDQQPDDDTPTHTDTSATVPVPDVCDGSDDMRLVFAHWFAGASDFAVDYVMYGEGTRFLMVRGDCHYFVYEGEGKEHLWWEPVREGDLDEAGIGALLTNLRVEDWLTLRTEDLSWIGYSPEWTRFQIGDLTFECATGCPPDGPTAPLIGAAFDVIGELASNATPITPEEVEVVAYETVNPVVMPLIVDWGASTPLSEVLFDQDQDDVSDMGTRIRVTDDPWFWDVRQQYLDGVPYGFGGAIQVYGEEGSPSEVLYVRPIPPGL